MIAIFRRLRQRRGAPSPAPARAAPPAPRAAASDEPPAAWIHAVAPLFDERYYLSRNPAARGAGVPPIEHYLTVGWRRGADPAPWFSTDGYLEINGDVAQSALPPFVHYALYGRAEGRTILPTDDVGRRPAAPPAAAANAEPAISPNLLALRQSAPSDDASALASLAAYVDRRLTHLA